VPDPRKPARKLCKGSFNVRVPVSVHRRAAEQATVRGISLNRLVQEALEREVGADASGGAKDVAVDTAPQDG